MIKEKDTNQAWLSGANPNLHWSLQFFGRHTLSSVMIDELAHLAHRIRNQWSEREGGSLSVVIGKGDHEESSCQENLIIQNELQAVVSEYMDIEELSVDVFIIPF